MERMPRKNADVQKIAMALCELISRQKVYTYQNDLGSEVAVIFRVEDLEQLEFDDSGQIDMDQMIDLIPKAIIPSHN